MTNSEKGRKDSLQENRYQGNTSLVIMRMVVIECKRKREGGRREEEGERRREEEKSYKIKVIKDAW